MGEHSAGHQSLDDAMRTLRRKAQASEQVLTDRSLGSFLAGFASAETISDIQNYISSGQTIPLLANALGSCFTLTKKKFYAFDPGFDLDGLYTGYIGTGEFKM